MVKIQAYLTSHEHDQKAFVFCSRGVDAVRNKGASKHESCISDLGKKSILFKGAEIRD